MEYNTTRNYLNMREYGRNVQKMAEYLLTIEDDEVRQKNTEAVIELMGLLNPQLKTVEDYKHKLWDHLFLISDFKLKVKSPYPIPTKEELRAKPAPLQYPSRSSRFSHLGKNLEDVIKKALAETDAEKKQAFANAIAYYMKLAYNNWHKEIVHDDAIQAELSNITNGELEFTNTPYVKAYSMKQDLMRERAATFAKRNNKYQQRNNNNNNNGAGNNNNRRNNGNGNNPQGNFKKKRF